MMNEGCLFILRWIINALALLVVSNVLPGFEVASFYSAFIAALVLGFVNATVRWVLIFLTLPINLLTLGLFTFVVNALMILLVSSVVKGFDVADFTTALVAAIILWLISLLTSSLLETREA